MPFGGVKDSGFGTLRRTGGDRRVHRAAVDHGAGRQRAPVPVLSLDGRDRLPLRRDSRARRRRARRRARRVHAPHPARRRARADPPGTARPDAGPDDARRHLRPADRDGLRAQARVLVGRQPGRRLAAPPAGRGRARLAARRSSSRSTRTPAWRPRTRPAHANLPFGVLRGYAGTDLAAAHAGRVRRLPVHGRAAGGRAGAPAGRRDHPRPAGRPARQRPALGDHRCAEGGRARVAALDRHRRGGRRRARAAARRPSSCRPG